MKTGNAGRLRRWLTSWLTTRPEPTPPGDAEYTRPASWEDVIDLLPSVAGIGFDELRRHITHLEVDGETIPVLDLRGLLATKQGTRPKDQADAAVLRRALERTSDKDEPT
jgi:hypothetical protein